MLRPRYVTCLLFQSFDFKILNYVELICYLWSLSDTPLFWIDGSTIRLNHFLRCNHIFLKSNHNELFTTRSNTWILQVSYKADRKNRTLNAQVNSIHKREWFPFLLSYFIIVLHIQMQHKSVTSIKALLCY